MTSLSSNAIKEVMSSYLTSLPLTMVSKTADQENTGN
jgi:hypothetical protein